MRNYYIVDCITGCKDGVEPTHSIAEARAKRDELNEADKAKGGSGEFWIIVDSKGNEVS